MRRKLAARLGCVAAILFAVIGSAPPAHAWQANVNEVHTYYVPGPPPGSYLSACYVDSVNGVFGRPFAQLQTYDNAWSDCMIGAVTVVYLRDGVLLNGPKVPDTPGGRAGVSTAPHPGSLVGANFEACNLYWSCWYWQTSPFG